MLENNLNEREIPVCERMSSELNTSTTFKRGDFNMNISRFTPNEIGINRN